MIEEQTGRCIFWVVLQRNSQTLLKIIEDHIVAGSTIKSDEWRAYQGLSTLGYNHLKVNHSISFFSLFLKKESIHK